MLLRILSGKRFIKSCKKYLKIESTRWNLIYKIYVHFFRGFYNNSARKVFQRQHSQRKNSQIKIFKLNIYPVELIRHKASSVKSADVTELRARFSFHVCVRISTTNKRKQTTVPRFKSDGCKTGILEWQYVFVYFK